MSPERSKAVSEAEVAFERLQGWGDKLGFEVGFLESEIVKLDQRLLNRFNDDLVAQLARTNRLGKDHIRGTVTAEEYRVQMNRISIAFIDTCREYFGGNSEIVIIEDQTTHGRPKSIEVGYSCPSCHASQATSMFRGGGCPGCGQPSAEIHFRKVTYPDGFIKTYN